MSNNTENYPSIEMHEPVFTIGVIAKKLDIAVQTIRLYEQEGLIIAYKTETGRRMYSMHDLERLKCIRSMITEKGMNLQGIKRIMALIPCWEFRGGLDDQCLKCPAYYEANGPCWSISNVSEKCKLEDCRSCHVYKINMTCSKLKEVIFGHRRNLYNGQNRKENS
jgi:MerR family transcriptional regulator, heat shock protein HspR